MDEKHKALKATTSAWSVATEMMKSSQEIIIV
jgi:hypothetical protein